MNNGKLVLVHNTKISELKKFHCDLQQHKIFEDKYSNKFHDIIVQKTVEWSALCSKAETK